MPHQHVFWFRWPLPPDTKAPIGSNRRCHVYVGHPNWEEAAMQTVSWWIVSIILPVNFDVITSVGGRQSIHSCRWRNGPCRWCILNQRRDCSCCIDDCFSGDVLSVLIVKHTLSWGWYSSLRFLVNRCRGRSNFVDTSRSSPWLTIQTWEYAVYCIYHIHISE